MSRKKINADIKSTDRRYNVYQGLLRVALQMECDVSDVRAALCEEAKISNAWLSNIERSGIDNNVVIRLEVARRIEAFFTKQLGYAWTIEIRPLAASAQTPQLAMAV